MLDVRMRLRIGPGRDDRTLVLEGELDVAAADQLVSAVELCSILDDDVILDCRNLSFVDGAGVDAFVRVAEALPAGSRLVLENPEGLVLRVLQMLRIDEHPRVVVRRSLRSA